MGFLDYKPNFSPSAESEKASQALKVFWIIECILDILNCIFNFGIFTLILSILWIWFYFFLWKSMSYVAAAFAIVFKCFSIILMIIAILGSLALAGIASI